MTTGNRRLVRRVAAVVGTAALLAAPLPLLLPSAGAATYGTGLPCVSDTTLGGITILPGESITFTPAAGCELNDNDYFDPGIFTISSFTTTSAVYASSAAVAPGTSTSIVIVTTQSPTPSTQPKITIPVTFGGTSPTQPATPAYPANVGPDAIGPACPYGGKLNEQGDLCVGTDPAPTPTPTPSPTATTTPTDGPTAAPVPATTTEPRPSQRLSRKDVVVAAGLKPGQVAFFGPGGMPLQLLSMTGDTSAISVVDDGINYSTVPANWQRLGYGDTCWTYAGYAGVQGFILPVATPPFSTVPANWFLTAAILGTTTGNVTFTDPSPGQTVDADGRDIATLTLCAKGYPNAVTDSAAERSALRAAPADRGGNQNNWVPGCSNGQATGNKHCTGRNTYPTYPFTVGPTVPGVITEPSSQPTPIASASASVEPEPTVTICQATVDPSKPYLRLTAVPLSRLPANPTAGENLYPTPGWTDIIPRTAFYTGQNWTTAGQEIYDFGCNVKPPTPSPTPTLTPTPEPTPTPTPAPVLTPRLDPLVEICQATSDPKVPYRLVSVRQSKIRPSGVDRLYPTTGWTDIIPPNGAYPQGQNWPAGAALLTEAKCAVTFVEPQPVQTISGFGPGPQASTPPPITGWSPAIVVTPIPQPSFTGYGPVIPWPPLQPVPLRNTGKNPDGSKYLVPPSPTPYATPSPTGTPTPSAFPTPPSPTPTPPTPTPTVTTITQPKFIGLGPVCGAGPCQITPVQRPGVPWTALVTITPSATGQTPSSSATPTASPSATPSPTSAPPGNGRVTLELTNGPDTVTYTTTVDKLLTVAVPVTSTTSTTKPTKPSGPGKPSSVPAGRMRGAVPTAP